MSVRVRIAPSPTGDPHIGTAYIALMNIAFKNRHGGEFLLRIEDTDQTRSTPESELAIFNSLKWLGLTWDEGPDVGGPHAPYRQSERKPMYWDYAMKLVNEGHAFKCFCTPDRLELMRATQRKQGISPRYDGHCLRAAPEELAAKEKAGEPYVIRMKVPSEGSCTFTDAIYGTITVPWSEVDMQVLMKSDGMPTYHLAVVVDDHLMGITDVIRGEEWVPSTPKHLRLYELFGWKPSTFTHLPLLRNPDRTKLSKRKNPTSILWFKAQGYLPEAIINYLGQGFLTLNEGDEEVMDREEFFGKFDFASASKAGPVFDLAKLDWFNGRWLRERLSDADYLKRAREWVDAGVPDEALLLAKTRIVKFSELAPLVSFTQKDADLGLSLEKFAHLKTTPEQTLAILNGVDKVIETLGDWQQESLWNAIKALEEPLGQKAKFITAPLFVAMSGNAQSLPLMESMILLGKDIVRVRLAATIALFEKA